MGNGIGNMLGGLTGGVGKFIGGIETSRNADKARGYAEDDKTDYYANLDLARETAAAGKYDPTYARDLVGPYQRSQSPLARAYLESMLTGDNPQANASPWAGGVAPAQDFGRHGAYDELMAKGAQHRSATPWETKRPAPVDTSALDSLADVDQSWGSGRAWESDRTTAGRGGKRRV